MCVCGHARGKFHFRLYNKKSLALKESASVYILCVAFVCWGERNMERLMVCLITSAYLLTWHEKEK